MEKKDYTEDRKLVGRITYKVLAENFSVREAILQFPKECEDISVKSAYHALVHREADEDLRRRDRLYKEEQDDYLEFIAQTLEKGDVLPDNIIRSYEKYYKDIAAPYEGGTKGFIRSICKYLNIS